MFSELVTKYRPAIVPERAEEVAPAVFRWENDGSVVMMPIFVADPTKASEEWLDEQRAGSTEDGFRREVLIDFSSWVGKRVYSEYNDTLHLSRRPLSPEPILPVLVGIDIPGPPAAVWAQIVPIKHGSQTLAYRLQVLAELFMDCSIQEFGDAINSVNATRFPSCKRFKYVSDPAAFYEITGTKRTAAEILREFCGIRMIPGPINLVDRMEPVRRWLRQTVPMQTSLDMPGAVLLDKSVTLLREALQGGYCFKKVAASSQFKETPDKNEHSHIANAFEYLCWAARPEEEKANDTSGWKPLKRTSVVAALE